MSCSAEINARRFLAPPFFNVNVELPPSGTPGQILVRSADGSPYAVEWADWGALTGEAGPAGLNGWTPVYAVVADGERRVLQVIDWTGGTGTKPPTGLYVGPAGFEATLAAATDIRGAVGPTGATGATGPEGPEGAEGRSVTSFSIDASQNLVATFSDSTTQVIGALNQDQRAVVRGPSANTALTNGAFTVLPFTTNDFTPDTALYSLDAPTAGRITVNTAGFYSIVGGAVIQAGAGVATTSASLAVFVNGAIAAAESNESTLASLGIRAHSISAIRRLNAGDIVDLRMFSNGVSAGASIPVSPTLNGQPAANANRIALVKLERGAAGGGSGTTAPREIVFAAAGDPSGTPFSRAIPAGFMSPGMLMDYLGTPSAYSSSDVVANADIGATVVIDETYARPFYVSRAVTLSEASVYVVTAAAGVCDYRIFATASNGRPGAPVIPKQSFNVGTTGLKGLSFTATTLQPGLYWLLSRKSSSSALSGFRGGRGLCLFYGGRQVTGLFQAGTATRMDSADLSGTTWMTDVGPANASSTFETVYFNFTPA